VNFYKPWSNMKILLLFHDFYVLDLLFHDFDVINLSIMFEWYYLKSNYLTLRSKAKIPGRSLRYATHRLMVMTNTKYHWPISKDKNVMVYMFCNRNYMIDRFMTSKSRGDISFRYLNQFFLVNFVVDVMLLLCNMHILDNRRQERHWNQPTEITWLTDLWRQNHGITDLIRKNHGITTRSSC
jgi:hypothetical protein